MKTPRYYLMIIVALAVAGCSQTAILYVPPPAHLPLLKDAGQADMSVLGGIYGIDVRAAWSPVKHLEVFGLGSYHDTRADSSEHALHSYGEIGAGWYTGKESIIFSVVAGYGWGHAVGFGRDFSWERQMPAYEVSGSYTRPFAGLGIGYSGRVDTTAAIEYREYGLTIRAARAIFHDIQGIPGTSRGGGWYVEPVLVSRIGSRMIQLEAQTGFTSGDYSAGVESVDYFFSVGIHLQLDRIF